MTRRWASRLFGVVPMALGASLGCTGLLGIDGDYVAPDASHAPPSIPPDSGPGGSGGGAAVGGGGGGGGDTTPPAPTCAGDYAGKFDGTHSAEFLGIIGGLLQSFLPGLKLSTPLDVSGTVTFHVSAGDGGTATVQGTLDGVVTSSSLGGAKTSYTAMFSGPFDCVTAELNDTMTGTISATINGQKTRTDFAGSITGPISGGKWTEKETGMSTQGGDGTWSAAKKP